LKASDGGAFTDPVPLGGVVGLALPPLAPRTAVSLPAVSPVSSSASSVLQQLHHLTLVDGIDTLRGREGGRERRKEGQREGGRKGEREEGK